MLLQATETSKLESLTSSLFGLAGVIDVIRDSNKLWGFDCSPFASLNAACNNQQVCCEDNHFVGVPYPSSISSY